MLIAITVILTFAWMCFDLMDAANCFKHGCNGFGIAHLIGSFVWMAFLIMIIVLAIGV